MTPNSKLPARYTTPPRAPVGSAIKVLDRAEYEALKSAEQKADDKLERAMQLIEAYGHAAAAIDAMSFEAFAHLRETVAEVFTVVIHRVPMPDRPPQPGEARRPHPLEGTADELLKSLQQLAQAQDAGLDLFRRYRIEDDVPDYSEYIRMIEGLRRAITAAMNNRPDELRAFVAEYAGSRTREMQAIQIQQRRPGETHNDDACFIAKRLIALKAQYPYYKNRDLWRALKQTDIPTFPSVQLKELAGDQGSAEDRRRLLLGWIEDQENTYGKKGARLDKRISKIMHDHKHCKGDFATIRR